MDQPKGCAEVPVREIPDGDQQQSFMLDGLSAVAEVRRWLRGALPADCPLLDDCVMVVSELAANAVEHGASKQVTVALSHGAGSVRGVLVEHGVSPKTPFPRASGHVVLEIARLLAMPVDVPVTPIPIEDLAEEGRGLVVVASLCLGRWEIKRTGEQFVTRWELSGCDCDGGGHE